MISFSKLNSSERATVGTMLGQALGEYHYSHSVKIFVSVHKEKLRIQLEHEGEFIVDAEASVLVDSFQDACVKACFDLRWSVIGALMSLKRFGDRWGLYLDGITETPWPVPQ